MTAIAHTNRLHALAIEHVEFLSLQSEQSDVLDVAFSLLFEQLLCAFVVEITELKTSTGHLFSLDSLIEKAQQNSSNWILEYLNQNMKETGHWLYQWRMERNKVMAFGVINKPVDANLIKLKSIGDSSQSEFSNWLAEFGSMLESARELNNQY